jgi:hypothetical protein
VLGSFPLAGVIHVVVEVSPDAGSVLLRGTLGDLESRLGARVLSHTPAALASLAGQSARLPPSSTTLSAGDVIVVDVEVDKLGALTMAARGNGN